MVSKSDGSVGISVDRAGRYPFDWSAWRRFYEALGPRGWPEATFRAALAHLNARAWERDEPAEPAQGTVIVVGHQRSGTTWLHRMLALQPGAGAMPLHALVCPSDTLQRALARERPAWLDRLQDHLLGPLDPLHRLRLHEPEEDEFLAWSVFRSPMNALDRPWPATGGPEIEDDGTAIRFHAAAVAKFARRSFVRHVGKNPHFTWRVAAVRAANPGVRLACLWRHPEAAIASRLSLVRAIWRRRGLARELAPHHVERVYASSVREYLGGLGAADLDLLYDELVADPIGTVRRVHATFGLGPVDPGPLGPHLRTGPSAHRYRLADFGLDADRVAADLEPVYRRLGFRRGI